MRVTIATARRLSILSRVLAASVGGYVLVNLANLALSVLLPAEQYKALLFAMQISFVIYTLAIIWVFSVRSATKAWMGLAVAAFPLAVIDAVYFLEVV